MTNQESISRWKRVNCHAKNRPNRSLPCNHTGNRARTRPPWHGGGRSRFTSWEEDSLVSQMQVVGNGALSLPSTPVKSVACRGEKDYVVLSTLHPFSLLCPSKCLALPPLRWLRTSPLFHHTHGFFPCYYPQYCNRLMTKIVFFFPSVIFLFFFHPYLHSTTVHGRWTGRV